MEEWHVNGTFCIANDKFEFEGCLFLPDNGSDLNAPLHSLNLPAYASWGIGHQQGISSPGGLFSPADCSCTSFSWCRHQAHGGRIFWAILCFSCLGSSRSALAWFRWRPARGACDSISSIFSRSHLLQRVGWCSAKRSWLLMVFGQCSCRIVCRHELMEVCTFFSAAAAVLRVSASYNRTELKNQIWVWRDECLTLFQRCHVSTVEEKVEGKPQIPKSLNISSFAWDSSVNH